MLTYRVTFLNIENAIDETELDVDDIVDLINLIHSLWVEMAIVKILGIELVAGLDKRIRL